MTGNEEYAVYGESTVEAVYARGAWPDWYRMRRWVEREGAEDGELGSAQLRHLAEDLLLLQQEDVAFTGDPHLAVELLRRHCPHRTSDSDV